jgi:hypothetical protein
MRLLGTDILTDAEIYAPDITIELTEERSALLEDELRDKVGLSRA